jgi:hypothetical protein
VVRVLPAGRTGNRLLNLLSEGDFQRLQPILKRVDFASGQVLYEARGSIDEIVFPISAVLSAVTVMRDGHAIEVATVGNEGLSGLTAFGVVTTSPHRVFAQVPGGAWRVDTDLFNAECQSGTR